MKPQVCFLKTKYIFLLLIVCPFLVFSQDTEESVNAIEAKTYALDGAIIAQTKSYFNEFGKPVQSQAMDFTTGDIWVNQILYDNLGRAAFKSFSAPISQEMLNYKDDFINSENGAQYSLDDINMDIGNPSPVGGQPNTLGWYYSENNSREPFQDITSYPFLRTVYSKLRPGKALKTLGGKKMGGGWRAPYVFTINAAKELSQEDAFGSSYQSEKEVFKTIQRDLNGVESVIFQDSDGKTLATARSGGDISRLMVTSIGKQGFVDIHIPKGENTNGIQIDYPFPWQILIYDLISETIVDDSPSSLSNGFYRVAISNVDNYDWLNNPVTIKYKENYYDYSLFYYDKSGKLLKKQQPVQEISTTYKYNNFGRLIQKSNPDRGITKYKYRNDGKIRFSQNSVQAVNGVFSFTNYDREGRPVESGEVSGLSFNQVDPDLPLTGGSYSDQNFTIFDVADVEGLKTVLIDNNFSVDAFSTQKYVAGRVSKTYTQSPHTSTTWYSYDIYGRVEWIVQDIQGLGVKTMHYEYYPDTGKVFKVYYQKHDPDEMFVHKYSYTEQGELEIVETSSDDQVFKEQANYSYYETGQLKRKEIAGGLQGVDYIYNLGGTLKSINNPILENDPGQDENDLFGMTLNYYNNDYSRSNTPVEILNSNIGTDLYDGQIKSIYWKNGSDDTPPVGYDYQYNKNNWLQEAQFDHDILINIEDDLILDSPVDNNEQFEAYNSISFEPGFEVSASSGSIFTATLADPGTRYPKDDYKVFDISYDPNGNILSLKRNKHTVDGSNAMDKLTYNYAEGRNQLDYVLDEVTEETNVDDIKSQSPNNYIYNEIGQLIINNQDNLKYSYNPRGLVQRIERQGKVLVDFVYNERGHRISKISYNNGQIASRTNYVRDISGNTIAIYSNKDLTDLNLYGNSRIGVHSKSFNIDLYELRDHLGNVRTVIAKNGDNAVAIKSKSDYYPFGMQMPDRNIDGQYRYAFQGQEKDDETGMEAFEARLWDSRLGRWLTVDPLLQHSSPYLGMGNNPVSSLDPDGRFKWEMMAKFVNLLMNGDGVHYNEEREEWYVSKTDVTYETVSWFYKGEIVSSEIMSPEINHYYKNPFYLSGKAEHSIGLQVAGDVNILSAEVGIDLYHHRVVTGGGAFEWDRNGFVTSSSELSDFYTGNQNVDTNTGFELNAALFGGGANWRNNTENGLLGVGTMSEEKFSAPIFGEYSINYDQTGKRNVHTQTKKSWAVIDISAAAIFGVHGTLEFGLKY